MTSCNIILDNFLGSYKSGSTISGYVVCLFDSRIRIRGIKMGLRGEEHTSWMDREEYYDFSTKNMKHHNVEYTGNNTIVSFDITLFGEGSIQPGRYEYPFTFTLPRDLPTTYVGRYGLIRYYLKANLDIPYISVSYGDEKPFNLISLIDFNEIKQELQLKPVSYEEQKTLCCLCCTSEPITMNVQLNKEAFVLGEVANVNIDLTNMSNANVDKVTLQLKMTIESKVTFPHDCYKETSEIVTFTSDTGVKSRRRRSYDFNLEIPKTVELPNFINSTLFRRWCEINVKARVSGCHTNMNVSSTIKLGHKPIQESTKPAVKQGVLIAYVTNIHVDALPSPLRPIVHPEYLIATERSEINSEVPEVSRRWSGHEVQPPGPCNFATSNRITPSSVPSRSDIVEGGDFEITHERDSLELSDSSLHDDLRDEVGENGPSVIYRTGFSGGQNGPTASSF